MRGGKRMAKIDIGPPHYEKMLPPVIKENYGKWRYHEIPKPGVLKHVSEKDSYKVWIKKGSVNLVGSKN